MNATDSDPAAREARARQYVNELRAFYQLLGTALLVVVITFVVNYATWRGNWWFLWVVFGFGVALAFAGMRLLLRRRLLGEDWEARKVREYMNRNQN